MLRQFAALWILFFGAIALRQYYHPRPTVAIVLGVLALTIGPLGLASPRLIKPVFLGWMRAAYPIGWVVSRVVLSLIFYVVFTPVALFLRLTGRDALALKRQVSAGSYWRSRTEPVDKRQYLRQY